jgi:hypothetical protein
VVKAKDFVVPEAVDVIGLPVSVPRCVDGASG